MPESFYLHGKSVEVFIIKLHLTRKQIIGRMANAIETFQNHLHRYKKIYVMMKRRNVICLKAQMDFV